MVDPIERIERLARLLDEGKISQEEYETLKSDVISGRRGSVPVGPSQRPSRSGRWWIERILLVVGIVGLVKNVVLGVRTGEGLIPISTFDPLIWAGVVGVGLYAVQPDVPFLEASFGRQLLLVVTGFFVIFMAGVAIGLLP